MPQPASRGDVGEIVDRDGAGDVGIGFAGATRKIAGLDPCGLVAADVKGRTRVDRAVSRHGNCAVVRGGNRGRLIDRADAGTVGVDCIARRRGHRHAAHAVVAERLDAVLPVRAGRLDRRVGLGRLPSRCPVPKL